MRDRADRRRAAGAGEGPTTAPAGLRVLYAGNPGSDRERDYVGFLRGAFGRVEAIDYRAFRDESADGFDVAILDWTSLLDRDAKGRKIDLEAGGGVTHPEPTPHPSAAYARPTILIGGAGERAVRPLRLKIDWGCLCLGDYAHGTKVDHPIFRGPFPVALDVEEIPTPPEYLWPGRPGPKGPTIRAWRVQSPRYFDADPGLVARGDEFEEGPDAEVISSGVNGKDAGMVAIGRHANYLLWGFASPPSEMTPAARNAFLNAACYIRGFDGRRPVVRKPEGGSMTRAMARALAIAGRIDADPEAYRRSEPHHALYDDAKLAGMREAELDYVRRHFPADVVARAATDPGAYLAWVEANDRWLVAGPPAGPEDGPTIGIDEDLKALGLDNRAVATLDACAALLGRGGVEADRALRALRRYTGADCRDQAGWLGWLDARRGRLAFTEVGGDRFVEAEGGTSPPAGGERLALEPPGPPKARFEPVRLSASVEPARVAPGGEATVTLRMEIAPRWHVAAAGGEPGPETPAYLRLALPAGVEPAGEWEIPEPGRDAAGHARHEGTVEFRRKVRVLASAPIGPSRIAPSASYQACDPSTCRPARLGVAEAAFEVAAPARPAPPPTPARP